MVKVIVMGERERETRETFLEGSLMDILGLVNGAKSLLGENTFF